MNNGLRQNGQPLTKDKKETIAQPVIGADHPESGLPLNSVLFSFKWKSSHFGVDKSPLFGEVEKRGIS